MKSPKEMGAVQTEGRGAFSLAWFYTLEQAKAFAAAVQADDRRYKGGMFHDDPCGREPQFDYMADLADGSIVKLWAVSY